MKKIIAAILCAGLIAVFTAGCSVPDALENTETTQIASDSQKETTPEIKSTDYDDSLKGLAEYFAKKGYLENNKDKTVKMDASLIGADEGNKYVSGKTITVELYSYNPSKLNDTAKKIIESVKKDGTFTILDLDPSEAYLSDNGKYLMVYTDTAIDKNKPDKKSSNYIKKQEVIDSLKAFYK